jgi:hypothetical protein
MHEIPAQWRAGEWYERWDRDFRPRSGECLSVVARFHSAACYRSTECLADVERELIYYDLEQYLFETVGPRFHLEGSLSAFDFFSIIIWKANRAKSRVAKGLRKHGMLESVVEELARALYEAKDCCDRFTVLTGRYGFRLPMASAILSVLWPDEFSIYDVRVCESFPGRFDKLADVSDSAKRWAGYEEYIEAVREFVPGTLSLRDKDRVLWARSAMQQLDSDLKKWNRD